MSRALPFALMAALSLPTCAAWAATPELVVDASSGKVLHSERATDPWYPASVTKLMTTYVALDQVRRGKASMSSLLTMSAYAASQPPSKIRMKPGQTMTLDNALKIIMVKSANDVATMIGENLGGGSVEGFADLMNEASRRIGMRESRWTNPSGLPDSRQQTSARDMALLARALMYEFPEHEHLFRIGAVQLGNKVMRNHNGLLGRYPGADGMKTGFICSGGFNVVASATQGGSRIITVVMGYGSARERDLRAADLFDLGFTKSSWSSETLADLAPSASFSPPDMRPIVCSGKRKQPQEDDENAVVALPSAGGGDNPISSFFAPSAFAGVGSSAPTLGSRRTLGPRVAFAPIPVWLGASAGAVDDGDAVAGKPTRLATKAVRTKRMGPSGTTPAAATAFAATPPVAEGVSVEPLRARAAPRSRTALRDHMVAKPEAEAKPQAKPGQIGGGSAGRTKLGAIPQKPKARAAESDAADVAGANPDVKPARKAAAKPKAGAPAKTAAAAAKKPAAAKSAAAGKSTASAKASSE